MIGIDLYHMKCKLRLNPIKSHPFYPASLRDACPSASPSQDGFPSHSKIMLFFTNLCADNPALLPSCFQADTN